MKGGADVGGSDHILEMRLQKFMAGERAFVHTCMVVDTNVIGDMDQAVLLGSFQLAISDAIRRLSTGARISFKEGVDMEAAFNALYDAAWNGEPDAVSKMVGRACSSDDAMRCLAIPTGIEAFDGELAFSIDAGDDQYFCWRDWETRAIRSVCLERQKLIAAFSTVMESIDSTD